MPSRYHIDLDRHLAITTYEGRMTDDDLLHHQRRLRGDPLFSDDLHQLIDARGVTHMLVTGDAIRALAEANVLSATSRRAILVASTAQFGLARMFQALRARGPERIEIFTDPDEAMRWLGPPTP